MPRGDEARVQRTGSSFALVVPIETLSAALRVPPRIRELLGLEVFAVAQDGAVSAHR